MVLPCHAATNILLVWRNLQFPINTIQHNLSFTDSWSECVLDIVTIKREVPDASPVHITSMEDLAMRNIKRFSQSNRKDKVKVYMDKNFTTGSQSALGLPIAIFDLILEGIPHFRK
jgi:hypothetical protein